VDSIVKAMMRWIGDEVEVEKSGKVGKKRRRRGGEKEDHLKRFYGGE